VHRAIAAIWTNWIPLMSTSVKKTSREELILQLAQLREEPARRKFLSRTNRWRSESLQKQLSDLVLEKIRVGHAGGVAPGDRGLLIAPSCAARRTWLLACATKANALHASGITGGAVEHDEQAAKSTKPLRDPKEAARHAEQSIPALILLGEYDSALRPPSERVEIFTRPAERGASQAWTTM